MSSIQYTSAGGTTSTYRYVTGRITWGTWQLNGFVFGRFPAEGGKEINAIVVNQALLQHPELAAGVWAAFCKSPQGLPMPEWQLLGTGQGAQPLQEGPSAGSETPDDVAVQLHALWEA